MNIPPAPSNLAEPSASAKKHSYLLPVLILLLCWVISVRFAGLPLLSLDEKILKPWWQSLYSLRLPVSVSLVGIAVLQWWGGILPASRNKKAAGWLWKIVDSRAVYFLLVLLTVILYRWDDLPGYELNPDLSQSITTARGLLRDSRFWVSVDVGTHGPGVSITQLVLPLFGFEIDYAGSRLLGSVILFICLCCVYAVIRCLANEHTARIVLVPSVFLVAALDASDFVEYNGEYPLNLLLMGAIACIARAFYPAVQAGASLPDETVPEKRLLVMLSAVGVLLGSVPWTKNQGVLLAGFLIAVAALGCFFINVNGVFHQRWRTVLLRLLCLGGGLVLPTIAVLSWVTYNHAFSLMLDSYFLWNLEYAKRTNTPLLTKIIGLSDFLRDFVLGSTFYHALLQPIILFAFVTCAWKAITKRSNAKLNIFILVFFILSLVACLTVVAPGNRFQHYLMLTIFPLSLLYSVLWISLFPAAESVDYSKSVKGAAPFLCGAVVLPFLIWGFARLPFGPQAMEPFPPIPSELGKTGVAAEKAEVVTALLQVATPGQYIAVWGWRPELFVLTDTLSATRSNTNYREVEKNGRFTEHFFNLYVEDLKTRKPTVFVDNANPSDLTVVTFVPLANKTPNDARLAATVFRYENYPGLKEWVMDNYILYKELSSGVRIFIRKGYSPPTNLSNKQ